MQVEEASMQPRVFFGWWPFTWRDGRVG